MQRTCIHCRAPFEISPADSAFYEKVSPVIPSASLGTGSGKKYSIPPPTHCPDCRQQRRLAWRNERRLYHRKCDLCGRAVISIYSQGKPFTVFCETCWWGDAWDSLDYGREVDLSQPFFSQLKELQHAVPRHKVLTKNCENCDYSPWQIDCRNCYLCTGGRYNEDCYYCFWPTRCQNCVDCTLPYRSQYCYECIDVLSCYECVYSIYLDTCQGCTFCYDCIGCKHCFLCTGLRQKEYCIRNEQRTKEEYEKMAAQFHISNQHHFLEAKKQFTELLLTIPHRDMRLTNCEECTGDLIKNSRNVRESYDVEHCEDCKFLYDIRDAKDSYDLYIGGFNDEQCYEGISILDSPCTRFSAYCWEGCGEVFYCDHCFSCEQCFGCIGLKRKSYCILNKQYTKEKYEELVPKIIDHMRKEEWSAMKSGSETPCTSWGEFFPITLSPFAYNETVAQEYFPLQREDAEKKGWSWHREKREEQYLGPAVNIPDSIENVPDGICDEILLCEVTGHPYKIIPQELQFYRKMRLPLPRKCPDQRHLERLAMRNPRKLWSRTCAKCGKSIRTSYAPERPEQVYCEQCYLATVY